MPAGPVEPIPSARGSELVSDTDVPIILARLEAKVDVALAQHSAQLQDHDRRLVDHDHRHTSTEGRLRALELQAEATKSVAASAVAGNTAQAQALEAARAEWKQSLSQTKTDLVAAIQDARPKPIWPALAVIVAAVALLLTLAKDIYGG